MWVLCPLQEEQVFLTTDPAPAPHHVSLEQQKTCIKFCVYIAYNSLEPEADVFQACNISWSAVHMCSDLGL